MTDSEKITLIGNMISDFWEFNEQEQIEKSALGMVTAIFTVVDFDGKDRK